MNRLEHTTQVPVPWQPAGLISWYAKDGTALAMATSWMALVCGDKPSVRAAWPGRHDELSASWRGGDFVLNVVADNCLERVRQVIRGGRCCMAVDEPLGVACLPGAQVNAPLLQGCPIQVECRGGALSVGGFEPEVFGEVVLLHRGVEVFAVDDVSTMCAGNLWGREKDVKCL